MTDNKNLTIMMDDNIDTLHDYMTIDRCRNLKLKEMRDNFLIENSLTCLNDQPTFFRRGMKSCIDHVYTNTPHPIFAALACAFFSSMSAHLT